MRRALRATGAWGTAKGKQGAGWGSDGVWLQQPRPGFRVGWEVVGTRAGAKPENGPECVQGPWGERRLGAGLCARAGKGGRAGSVLWGPRRGKAPWRHAYRGEGVAEGRGLVGAKEAPAGRRGHVAGS